MESSTDRAKNVWPWKENTPEDVTDTFRKLSSCYVEQKLAVFCGALEEKGYQCLGWVTGRKNAGFIYKKGC